MLRAVLGTTVAASVGLFAAAATAQNAITFLGFGGQVVEAEREAWFKPFTEKTGAAVNTEDYDGGLARLRAMARSNNVTVDVIEMESQNAEVACSEGLLETIDVSELEDGADGTPAAEDFIPGGLHECGPGLNIWSNTIAYDASKFPEEEPTSPADFFDKERFPGNRGLSKRPESILEWALMADGVPLDEIYDTLSTSEGVDRAFAMLDRIKEGAVFWDAGAQPPQMLAAGNVTMTTAYSGRIYLAAKETQRPLVNIWNGQLYNIDYLTIPKGSKNKELALEFIRIASSSKGQADVSLGIPYGPARLSSNELVDPEIRDDLPTSPENLKNALAFNSEWWAAYGDEMTQRYAAWMAQ